MVLYAGVTARTGGAPTYNSVDLTQAQSRQGVTETSVEMWYLLAPPTSQSLTVNVPNDNGRTMWVYVATGNAGADSTCALDSSGVNATTGANPNVSVTTVAAGCLIFAVVATGDNGFAPTARTGTSLYEEDIAAYGGAGQYYVKSGTGAQSMSWTEATSDDYGAIAVAFQEVASPIVRTINDALGVTDSRTLLQTVSRNFDESVGISEARTKMSEASRTQAESLGIADEQTALRGILRTLEEGLALSDDSSALSAMIRTLSEELGLTDDAATIQVLEKTRGEVLGVTDSIDPVYLGLKTVAADLGLSDLMSYDFVPGGGSITRTINDSLGLMDQIMIPSSNQKIKNWWFHRRT
ncbi:MAG: hypothetical protein V2A79_10040 [Planctomycetota bacterium]